MRGKETKERLRRAMRMQQLQKQAPRRCVVRLFCFCSVVDGYLRWRDTTVRDVAIEMQKDGSEYRLKARGKKREEEMKRGRNAPVLMGKRLGGKGKEVRVVGERLVDGRLRSLTCHSLAR